MSPDDDAQFIRTCADRQAIADADATSAHRALRAVGRELWLGLHRLGFTGGRVLVQGDGAEALLNLGPPTEPGIATISATVGPPGHRPATRERSTSGGFGLYDAVISVLPHADVQLHTRHALGNRTSMHAELALLAIANARPGGLVAVLANHHTMDATSELPRLAIETLADLVGAVRLPSGALRPRMTGTDAVTDLLLFSRRAANQPSRSRDFLQSPDVPIDGDTVPVNTYFQRTPDHVLGSVGALHLPGQPPPLTVTGHPQYLAAELRAVLAEIADLAQQDGLIAPPPQVYDSMTVHAIHHRLKSPHARPAHETTSPEDSRRRFEPPAPDAGI